MSDIVHRLRWWPTKVERLEAEPEPAFRLMLEAAEEIERLRLIVSLWDRCYRQASELRTEDVSQKARFVRHVASGMLPPTTQIAAS